MGACATPVGRRFTDPVPAKQEQHYIEKGIDAFHGLARFTGPDALTVAGRELEARYILIATGARPALVRRSSGARVTVLQSAERMLPAFDADLVGWLMDKFHELGIEVRIRSAVQRIEKTGDAASSGPPLTPVASHDAKIVAANLLDGNRHEPDYRGVPSVAFTLPPIAAVGYGEAEALSKGLKFRLKSEQVSGWYTARRRNESVYGFKTLVEEGTDRILGSHLVGPHADEVINVFALAIRNGERGTRGVLDRSSHTPKL